MPPSAVGSPPGEPAGTRPHAPGPPDGDQSSGCPVRADGLQLFGTMRGTGYRTAPALVRRTDGQTITLTGLLYRTLEALEPGRTWVQVADEVSEAVDREVTADDVRFLVEHKLRPLGLVRMPGGAEPAASKLNPLLALKLKVVVTDEELTRRLTTPFAVLFSPVVVVTVLAAFAAISWWVLFDKGLASAVHQTFFQPGLILALWALVVASAGFHEFGHAAACRYGGARPAAMGAGLYLVWPAFYTDVTDSYRLGRLGRLRVDLGGLYFNALFAVGTWGLWWAVRWDALLLAVVAQHLQMARQLAPFIRADGYHIVADLTGVPDLFAHIKPTLMGVLPRRWRRGTTPALKLWARAVVVLWVAAVLPVLVVALPAAALVMPHLLATAWASMQLHWASAVSAWSHQDLAAATVEALLVVLVALPVASTVYLLARITRRTVRRVARATEGSPPRRAAALLGGVALAAGLAWAWWPADQYRPVDPTSRGAVGDLPSVVPDVARPVSADTTPVPVAGTALRPAALPLVPAAAFPVPGAVLGVPAVAPPPPVPVVGPSAPAGQTTVQDLDPAPPAQPGPQVPPVTRDGWPFPFPPPPDPAAGDNRATAVNTTDGATVTDLEVSWAMVTGERLEQENEAWALAVCRRCATRAVAFQVLLALPDVHIIKPVNAAVAANYACTVCRTEAIASQLVLTVSVPPSDQARASIEDVLARLRALGPAMDAAPAAEVDQVLQAAGAEIMQILRADGVLGAGGPSAAPSAAPSSTPSADVSPSATPTPTGEPSVPSSPAATDGTPAPSAPPTPSDTATPSAAPSSADPTPTATAPSDPAGPADPGPTASTAPADPGPSPPAPAEPSATAAVDPAADPSPGASQPAA